DVTLDGIAWPATLAPGQAVIGTARFRPRELGDAAAQASLPASDGAPGLLSMRGAGYGAVAQVSPGSFFVGPTALGTTRSGSLQITNVGLDPQKTAPLTVSNVSVISPDPAWSLDTATPIEVGEPGGSATLRFSFTPNREGMSQAILEIASNDGLHPAIRIPVAGLGRALQPCTLSVLPKAPVDFGPVPVHHSSVQGFELTNVTSPADDCVVGDPIITGDPAFRWPGNAPPGGRTLPPGGRMSVRIEFAP